MLLSVRQRSTKNVPVLEHSMPELLRAAIVNKGQKDWGGMIAHRSVERIAAYSKVG